MAASYPSSVKVFTTHVNITEVIDAGHPNSIQEEVVAIESTLGVTPGLSTTPNPNGTFTATSTSYATLNDRLANIETGVVSDAHTQYIRKAGDSANIVTAGSSGIKPLILKGASGQSVNLQEWQNNAGSALAAVDQSGNLTANSFVKTGGTSSQFLKADGSVDSNTYLTSGTLSGYQAKFTVNTTAKTSAYTLASGDYESMVQMNGAFAFTVGTGLSAAPVGTQIHLLALTTGVTVAASGVTLNGTPGLKLRAAYSSATLICLGTNNWVLIGDLSA